MGWMSGSINRTSDVNMAGSLAVIDGFVQLTTYLHEQVGWYYYKARGWAKE